MGVDRVMLRRATTAPRAMITARESTRDHRRERVRQTSAVGRSALRADANHLDAMRQLRLRLRRPMHSATSAHWKLAACAPA